jgi:methionine-rich copper-binding protein CopC
MNASSIGASTFVLRNSGGTTIPATVGYDPSTFVATLTPLAALSGSTTYTATLVGGVSGAKDSAGNALVADFVWSFTTAAVDTTPPTVSVTSPVNGATGVSGTDNVTATFSEAMDATTISASTVELRDVSDAPVEGVVTYNSATRVVTINPTPTLASAGVYTVVVRGGTADPRVKDVAGNALLASATWSFTVAGDSTPPTVAPTSPASGATGVSGTASVKAQFSEAMNSTTISTSTVELRDASNGVVPAAVSYNTSTRVVTINPTPTLTQAGVYSVIVRGGATDPRVKDVAGNALAANATWSFTVAADTTPPTVTATVPASNATGVSRTANITATFSEAMAPTTISTSTVELLGPAGPVTPVTAVVTLSTNGRKVTLNPAPTLAPLTTYTLIIKGGPSGVTDLTGNAMVGDASRTFTTQ